ncbi:MAG: hypothetical protein KDA75_05580, partial [Planctomycetaceae bacterium]|nr:hypothetical protein [Planctomycetaceae bacterium]
MRRIEWLGSWKRRQGNASTVVVGGLGLAVVAGALWMFRSQPADTPVSAPAPVAEFVVTELSVPVPVAAVEQSEVDSATVAELPQLTLAEQIQGHLTAGEFGSAVD